MNNNPLGDGQNNSVQGGVNLNTPVTPAQSDDYNSMQPTPSPQIGGDVSNNVASTSPTVDDYAPINTQPTDSTQTVSDSAQQAIDLSEEPSTMITPDVQPQQDMGTAPTSAPVTPTSAPVETPMDTTPLSTPSIAPATETPSIVEQPTVTPTETNPVDMTTPPTDMPSTSETVTPAPPPQNVSEPMAEMKLPSEQAAPTPEASEEVVNTLEEGDKSSGKSKKGGMATLIVLIVVIVALLGTIGYFAYKLFLS